MGLEYSCVQGKGLMGVGEGLLDQASVDAMKAWHINAVRLPLNEHCWLGVEGTPNGAAYQQGVENYVNLLVAAGIYVILDLHWSAPRGAAFGQQPMPNTVYSADFWKSVATRFKSNPAVVFDLFNEPIPNDNANDALDAAAAASWACWRDGGVSCNPTMSAGSGGPLASSDAVGMQTLVTAVRSTGATNVIMLGGIQWAGTIWSSVTRNWLTYKPNDPLNQLVAGVHIYGSHSWCRDLACFDREIVPIATLVPVVIAEFGSFTVDPAFLGSMMSWADAHGVSYLAWSWMVGDASGYTAQKLLTNYDGTPNDYGRVVRDHLVTMP